MGPVDDDGGQDLGFGGPRAAAAEGGAGMEG
jgi:hypothetical protein